MQVELLGSILPILLNLLGIITLLLILAYTIWGGEQAEE
jgi:hypothetical protein